MKKLIFIGLLSLTNTQVYAESSGAIQCTSHNSGLIYMINDDIVNSENCFQVYENDTLLLTRDLISVEYASSGKNYKYGDKYTKIQVLNQTKCGWFKCDYKYIVSSEHYPELNDLLTDCKVID